MSPHITGGKSKELQQLTAGWAPLPGVTLAFCSSRTGLLAHSPLVLGVGGVLATKSRLGAGEILGFKCSLGLTSFETGLSLPWTLMEGLAPTKRGGPSLSHSK